MYKPIAYIFLFLSQWLGRTPTCRKAGESTTDTRIPFLGNRLLVIPSSLENKDGIVTTKMADKIKAEA